MKIFAPIVQRKVGNKNTPYFDCSKIGGGFFRCSNAPGAVVIDSKDGTMLDIKTGEVYIDDRFIEGNPLNEIEN